MSQPNKRSNTIAKPKLSASDKKTTNLKPRSKMPHVRTFVSMQRKKLRDYLNRRPHRSFRLSTRSDKARPLVLPGYWSFTNSVRTTLWSNRVTFMLTIGVYGLLSGVFVGLASQETYTAFSESLRETGSEVVSGDIGQLGQASILLVSGISGGFSTAPTEVQQIYAVLIGLLTWLAVVWLLRAIQADKKPRFRDALYNSGSPIVATFLVLIVAMVQLLPAAFAVIAMGAALGSGFIDGGAVAMIFSAGAVLLCILSAYWLTSTLVALIIVTLPGMYPWQAIRAAGDLVVGRRLKILLRWLWLSFILTLLWVTVMVPIIMIDAWLKDVWQAIDWLPIVPVSLLAIGAFSIVFTASYVYLLYRKVVDYDIQSA